MHEAHAATQPVVRAGRSCGRHEPQQSLQRVKHQVAGPPAVQAVAWVGHKAHGKLVLEHDDGCPEQGPVGEQLEGERRGYLVRDVGHAQVKVGELCLQDVPLNDLPSTSLRHAGLPGMYRSGREPVLLTEPTCMQCIRSRCAETAVQLLQPRHTWRWEAIGDPCTLR